MSERVIRLPKIGAAASERRAFIGGSDARVIMGDDEAVRAAHVEFVAALAAHPPRPIPIVAHAVDIEDRADHLNKVFDALSAYVAAILDDTAQNVPGSLDFRDVEAILTDLASDVNGTIQHGADAMAGRVA
jgi:hypothetical protein